MSDLGNTVDILSRLVGFPTVSAWSNLEMIAWLAERLEHAGARVAVMTDESGHKANLFATLGPDGDGGVVLSGHTDVVPADAGEWNSDPFALVEHAGLLHGRGTCDMKGFIAACIAMLPHFAERRLTRPLHFAFTHDEEVGCIGAQALVKELQARGIRPEIAIIGEPTSMRIVEGHKGCNEYTVEFHGCEGHGSAPDLGVNAAEYAARYVGRLLGLREALKARAPADSRFDPPWTTINVGRVVGGVAHNVIAGHAEVDWEMRPVQATDARFVLDDLADYVRDELLPAMRAVDPRADILTRVIGEVVGLEPADENAARALVAELTGANAAEVVPFGTEAGLFQQMGVSAVLCGPGSIAQAHKPDEFVSYDQLELCLDMLGRLGARLAA